MPKHDFLTPKAIANRIKSKGLQKLRWYCQMCQKQCRDENGFKCHITSESHQRQLLLVAENPGRVIGEFSKDFLSDFLQLLRTSYGTRRVNANEVYQQYIKDKNHYHMNATRWETLTGFIMFMGREGICEVENTPKGWFIKYIDRSPATLAKMAAANKKKKMNKDDEDRLQKAIEEQIARALASKDGEDEEEPTFSELYRESEEEKIVLNFKGGASETTTSEASETTTGGSLTATQDQSQDSEEKAEEEITRGGDIAGTPPMSASSVTSVPSVTNAQRGGFSKPKVPPAKIPAVGNVLKGASGVGAMKKKEKKPGKEGERKRSALEEIREMEERKRVKLDRTNYWIAEGIVVKVMHKKLGEKFYKRKGKVLECKDRYTAVVEMLESGDVIKIDQAHLETVIPAIGGMVLIVNGGYRGMRATLDCINIDSYSATVTISKGPTRGRVVKGLPYEDISKLAL